MTDNVRSEVQTTLSEEDREVLESTDYQVINNGIWSWASLRFTDLEKYVQVLRKRDSELDRRVSDLFIRAMTAYSHSMTNRQEMDAFPYSEEFASLQDSYRKIIDTQEDKLDQCGQEYIDLAPEFMSSYGLVDYGTALDRITGKNPRPNARRQ